MKRILFLFGLLLVSVLGMAQAPSNYTNINGRYRWIAGMFDSTFSLPKGTTPSLRTGGSSNPGALFYRTTDSTVKYWTGSQWLTIADTGRFVPYNGAIDTLNMGQFGVKTKFVQFDTSSRAVTDRTIQWSNDNGTLAFGMTNGSTITQNVGLQQFARVKNVQGSQINKGQVVYLYSASGDRAAVKLADNRNDSTSSKTLGIAVENIPINGEGFVGTFGTMSNLNLSAFAPGDQLYLDSIPGGLTKTKPQAPYHLVFIGIVERANSGNGLLFTNVQNGYELEELHNVRITSPVRNNALLAYDSVRRLWVDTTLNAIGGISGSGTTNYVSKFTETNSLGNSKITDGTFNEVGFEGTGVAGGSLNFKNYSSVSVKGAGYSSIYAFGTKFGFSYIPSAEKTFYLELNGLTNNTTRTYSVPDKNGTLALTSDITDAISGTTNYIPKFTSSSAIGNSQIFDNGTAVGIGAASSLVGKLTIRGASSDNATTVTRIAKLNAAENDDAYLDIQVDPTSNLINLVSSGTNTGGFSFYRGGSEMVRFTSAGEVLIGTTSDAGNYLLQVNGNVYGSTYTASSTGAVFQTASAGTSSIWSQVTNTGGTSYFGRDNSTGSSFGTAYATILYSTGAYPLNFYTNSLERMRLDASGNLGIGTTSPATKIQISDATNPIITLERVDANVTDNELMGQINFKSTDTNDANSNAYINAIREVSGVSQVPMALTFGTGVSATVAERMRITSGGILAVGTTSPYADAIAHFYQSSNASRYVYAENPNTGTSASVFFNAVAGAGGDLRLGAYGTNHSTQANNATVFNHKLTGSLLFGTEGTERMRVTSGGSLVVGGTTADASAIVQITSTTKGFLPPVMTGAQAEAISATPAAGLLIYANNGNGAVITSIGWWGYNGTTWVKLN